MVKWKELQLIPAHHHCIVLFHSVTNYTSAFCVHFCYTRPLEIHPLSDEKDTSLCWVVLEQFSVSVPWCQCITSTNCYCIQRNRVQSTVSLQTHFTLCTSQKCRVFFPRSSVSCGCLQYNKKNHSIMKSTENCRARVICEAGDGVTNAH